MQTTARRGSRTWVRCVNASDACFRGLMARRRGYRGCMPDESGTETTVQAIDEANAIARDRYDLDQAGASALMSRLALHHKVELRIIAAAIIAAALARRRLAAGRT